MKRQLGTGRPEINIGSGRFWTRPDPVSGRVRLPSGRVGSMLLKPGPGRVRVQKIKTGSGPGRVHLQKNRVGSGSGSKNLDFGSTGSVGSIGSVGSNRV